MSGQYAHEKQSGFTLVELAISIAVIGLLIGGVLKGMELVDNARMMSMIKQVAGYNASTASFVSMYGTLPGDIKNPGDHLPNCSTMPCTVSGNEDSIIISASSCGGSGLGCEGRLEQENYFTHLYAAGLLKGSMRVLGTVTSGSDSITYSVPNDFPYNSVRNITIHHTRDTETMFDLATNPAPRAGHYYFIARLPIKVVEKMDYKLDDGRPYQGELRIEDMGGADITNGVTTYKNAYRYSQNVDANIFWMTDF